MYKETEQILIFYKCEKDIMLFNLFDLVVKMKSLPS
jgi:hypothetical protein